MKPKISVIVLNYNGLNFLKKCIPTIQKQTYKNIEIIVSDNHSNDGSLNYLTKFSKIVVIKNNKNFGYSKANNLAAKKATGDFLFFLNNDTELFVDAVENLMKCYKERSIMTARQIPVWNKKYYGSSGAGIDIFGYPYVEDQNNPRKTRVFYADGAMFFIKKKDFVDLGMFDEALFIFQEDIDLSWRAHLFGYKIISCWEAKLYHHSGGTVLGGSNNLKKYTTSYLRRYLNEKNTIRNILKNYSFPLGILVLAILLIAHCFEIVVLTLFGKWKVIQCYLKAYCWNITHLGNTLSFRKYVQRRRRISDIELIKKMYWTYAKLHMFIKLGIPEFQ